MLDDLERLGNPLDQMTRDNVAGLWLQREVLAARVLAPIPLAGVRDAWVPARNRVIPVRIYTPADRELACGGRLPVLVYYHGGGWTLGSLATYDSLCRALLAAAAAWWCRSITAWRRSTRSRPRWKTPTWPWSGSPATPTTSAATPAGWPSAATAPAAPWPRSSPGGHGRSNSRWSSRRCSTHRPTSRAPTRPSYQQYGQGYWLTTQAVETFRSFYLPDPNWWRHPDASPLLAPDKDLRLLPPTLVMTAGCDVLRDEGQAYADRLAALGVPVVYRLEPELIHAGLNLFNSPFYPDASRRVEPVVESLARAIRAAWTTKPGRCGP